MTMAEKVGEALKRAGFKPRRAEMGVCLDAGFFVHAAGARVIVEHRFPGLHEPVLSAWTPRLREYRKALEAAGFTVRKDYYLGVYPRLEVVE